MIKPLADSFHSFRILYLVLLCLDFGSKLLAAPLPALSASTSPSEHQSYAVQLSRGSPAFTITTTKIYSMIITIYVELTFRRMDLNLVISVCFG